MTDAAPSEPVRPGPLVLSGDLTIQHAATRNAELLDLLYAHLRPLQDDPLAPGTGTRVLALDLCALGDIDSAGLQILVAAERLCARYGASLHLEPRSRSLDEALDTFWLDPSLKPRPRPGAYA